MQLELCAPRSKLLSFPSSLHLVCQGGFCLSFLSDGAQGKIAAVGVLPERRRKGLGTALIVAAKAGLQDMARQTDEGD